MRRLLATAAMAVTLLIATACASERADNAGPAPSAGVTASATASAAPTLSPPTGGSPGAPPPVTAPAGGNAEEVCAAAVQLGTTSAETFFTELARMMQASAANDTKTADAARTKAQAALKSWATGLSAQAGRATDPQLKAVLTEVAAEVGTMRVDLDSINESKLEQLRQRLDALCGR